MKDSEIPKHAENFLMFRKTVVLLFLAINQIAIDDHIEYAARTLDQLRFHPQGLLDRIRQTGGSRFIVSLHAVFDADLHSGFLFSGLDGSHLTSRARQ